MCSAGSRVGRTEPEMSGGGPPVRSRREQQLYQDYLNRLRKLDRKVHHTPAGTVGPLERGFSEITNATDFKGWVVGFS